MKKLIPLVASLALLVALALPASAQGGPPCIPTASGSGAASCTVNMHDFTFLLPGGPPCSPDANSPLPSAITGNTIAHVTVSPDGQEFWATETLEGTFAFPAFAASPLDTGHAAAWFAIEFNQRNIVNHATIDGNGTSPLGSFGFHQTFQMTINAQGVVTVSNMVSTCR
jgi:hypothetical protein